MSEMLVYILLLTERKSVCSISMTWGSFAPQGTPGNVWKHFWLSQLAGATGT